MSISDNSLWIVACVLQAVAFVLIFVKLIVICS